MSGDISVKRGVSLADETPAAAPEPPPLLRQPEFLKLWAAQSISQLGDQVTLLALPLVAVLTLDASAAQMEALVAAELPHLFFSLLAGVWIERSQRRRHLMIVADVGRAVLLASVPIAYAFDVLSFPQLYAVAFAVGTFAVMFDVSWSTLFVAVVPRRDVVDANSKMSLSAVSFVTGPSIGGVPRPAADRSRDAARRCCLVPRIGDLPDSHPGADRRSSETATASFEASATASPLC